MIDLLLLALIGLSALLGLFRGFVGIVVGTASWLLAGWATFQFGAAAGRWLAGGAHPSATESLGGYALVFVGVLVAVALVGMAIRAGVDAVRLNGTDRMLGFLLGLVRGAFFACVLVLLLGFTPLAHEPAWRESRVLPLLLPGAKWMRAQLPDWSVQDVDLGKLPVAGDNGVLDKALSVSSMQETVVRTLGRTPDADGAHEGDPAQALPSNIDPAQDRAGENGSPRAESHGQARPPSQQ
ncbi:CvpA family protein [Pseudomonas sp. Hp2]|uniref:CvpA family protein n=1 Tax=Pseudomonas sp. Hp2 TaxID=701189 RepID=UPI0011299A6E|nr:CvpA family protein [Pseudomonas sp. Hp2]